MTLPFGQKVEGAGKQAKRVPDEEAAIVVENMRALRKDGLTYAAIADRLNAEGVETARGGRWHANSVRRVLGREAR
jgi:hypothetical protein